MRKLTYILVAILAGSLLACEETIVLDLDQTETKFAFDGLITDDTRHHYIRITKTQGFYEGGRTPTVNEATVMVTEQPTGTTYQFVETDTLPGTYFSEVPFAGKINHAYQMEVVAEGETFTATDTLFRTGTLDSLGWQVDEDEQDDPEEEGRFYEMLVYAKEPQDSRDYYLFKFYRNEEEIRESETDIYFADDELVQENIDGLDGAGFYNLGDSATFEMYSISRQVFVYYSDLSTVMNNDGGLFGPVPANPRTNIEHPEAKGVGLFQASSIARGHIIIGE